MLTELRCSECQLIQHHNYPRVQSQWELTLNPRWRRTRTVNKQKNTIISASRKSSNGIDDDMASPAKLGKNNMCVHAHVGVHVCVYIHVHG